MFLMRVVSAWVQGRTHLSGSASFGERLLRETRYPNTTRKRNKKGLFVMPAVRVTSGARLLVETPSLAVRFSKLIILSLAVRGIVLLLGALVWGYQHKDELIANAPVKQVIIRAPMQYLSSAEIERRVTPFVSGGFFSVNLAALEADLEQQPWINRAVVSRHWPASIEVKVVERKPAAIWGEGRLLDQNGELFQPNNHLIADPLKKKLPQLSAPDNYAHWVMQQYQEMNNLFQQINVNIESLRLSPQMSWYVTLSNGVTLKVDRNNTMQKLEKLVAAYPRLDSLERTIDQIDLRYLNGFSVKWREEGETIRG